MFTCSLLFWHYFSFIRCLCWLSGKESTVWSSTSPTQKPRIGFWTKWTAYIVIWAWSMSSWKAVRETFRGTGIGRGWIHQTPCGPGREDRGQYHCDLRNKVFGVIVLIIPINHWICQVGHGSTSLLVLKTDFRFDLGLGLGFTGGTIKFVSPECCSRINRKC